MIEVAILKSGGVVTDGISAAFCVVEFVSIVENGNKMGVKHKFLTAGFHHGVASLGMHTGPSEPIESRVLLSALQAPCSYHHAALRIRTEQRLMLLFFWNKISAKLISHLLLYIDCVLIVCTRDNKCIFI